MQCHPEGHSPRSVSSSYAILKDLHNTPNLCESIFADLDILILLDFSSKFHAQDTNERAKTR